MTDDDDATTQSALARTRRAISFAAHTIGLVSRMAKLSPREEKVIRMRMGLNWDHYDSGPKGLKEHLAILLADPFFLSALAREHVSSATYDELDAATRAALASAKVDDDDARLLLVDALAAERSGLIDALKPIPTTREEAAELVDGVPVLDERFAAYLETKLDDAALAQRVREKGRERGASPETLFDLWIDRRDVVLGAYSVDRPGPGALPTLARALWDARVRERASKAAIKRPALSMVVHEPVADLFSRGLRREEESNGQRALRLPGDVLVRVAHIDASVIPRFVDRGIAAFGGVTAHRTLRWQVFAGHRQALDGAADPRLIRVEGGYAALAHDELGLSSKKAADEVRAIIEAEHAIELPLPTGSTRLLIREFTPAVGRRPSQLVLVLGTALLPDYVHALKRAGSAGRELRLVPVLELPPFVGKRSNEHGAQASLSMLVAAHMRDHARELVEAGGVTIDETEWKRLAARAGLPVSMVRAVLDRWTQDGSDAPAFLKLVERNRYALTDAKAHAFLTEGGRGEIAGSVAGKASARKREQAKGRALQRGRKRGAE